MQFPTGLVGAVPFSIPVDYYKFFVLKYVFELVLLLCERISD